MKHKIETVLYIFIALAIVFSLVSFSLITGRMDKIKEAERLAEIENRPANLNIIRITDSSCSDCFDIDPVIESIKKANANITSERSIDFSSDEAKQLIDKYEIKKLPTIVVTGEVNKSNVVNLWNQNWFAEMKDGTQVSSVYVGQSPPYRDIDADRVLGLVSVTRIVDPSCDECASLNPIINSFRQVGAVIKNDVTVEYDSAEGNDLIKIYGVREIPAMIISKDILDYPQIAQIWPRLNATEKNGSYALHVLNPPYRDVALDKVVGIVDVIYLNDSTCTNCYNVLVHKQILGVNFGVFLINETVVDINSTEGKAVVNKYNITKAPVFVMSPDAKYYTALTQIWPSVGTVENGWYVFRNVTAIGGIYRDLTTGRVVVPAGG